MKLHHTYLRVSASKVRLNQAGTSNLFQKTVPLIMLCYTGQRSMHFFIESVIAATQCMHDISMGPGIAAQP